MLRPLVALAALIALGVSAFAAPSKRPHSAETSSLKRGAPQPIKKKPAKPTAYRPALRP